MRRVSLAFHDFDFFLRQSIQLIYQLVNLPIRRVYLTLVQRAVMFRRGGLLFVKLEHLLDQCCHAVVAATLDRLRRHVKICYNLGNCHVR